MLVVSPRLRGRRDWGLVTVREWGRGGVGAEGGVRSWGFGWVGGDPFIGYLGHVTRVVVRPEVDGLSPAVGEQHGVLPLGHLAVRVLVVTLNVAVVLIVDGVGEGEGHPGL